MYFPLFMKRLVPVIFALAVTALSSGWNSTSSATQERMDIRQFDLLTEASGWILLDGHLFRTSDAGQSWEEITPAVPAGAEIQDVQFMDVNTGWVLWTTFDSSGSASFSLAQTMDGGQAWTSSSLSLVEPGDIASYMEKAEMDWFDTETGWISVKQQSGSNFSLGTLFTTSDGGTNWERFTLPVADHVIFSDPQQAWAVGGPAGDEIFQTQDGGATWRDARPADLPNEIQATAYPPFARGGGALFVATTMPAESYLNIYSLENSDQWLLLDQVKLDSPSDKIGLFILDVQNFVATIPGTDSLVRMKNGEVEVLNNQDGRSAAIVQLDMVSLDIGWAKSITSDCSDVSCSTSTRLLQTKDGGLTWHAIQLPLVGSDTISSAAPKLSSASTSTDKAGTENTEVYLGQGFDKCEIPSLSQMQTWWRASPYQAVNLYIGGSSRACANNVLTSTYVADLYKQGWMFIPTWVGPQAPCTGYPSRMSSDVTTAFGQGMSEANLAVERLAVLGLTDLDKTGSVVYYDIEHYGTNTACRAAVNAFMNGWVSQIHARGNVAGVYGSTLCNTGLSDFRNITHVPDVIWPARWYHNLGEGYYDPTASVWNLGSCLPNTAWANHQRIRQYEGDHTEIWGGVALGIDSNVLDGMVAIPDTDPVEVKIGGNTQGTYNLVPRQIRHERYAGINNGPIQILSPGSAPLVASERVIYRINGANTSFTEMMALPNSQLDSTYWLPWYNNVDLDTQLRFANVSGTTASVKVFIGGTELGSFNLAPGESTRRSFAGINDGPVKIQSTVNIVAAERLIYRVNGVGTSFTEMMALPNSQLDNTYWLPWYNNLDLDTQLRMANITNQPATVHIYIAGQEMQGSPILLGPSESNRISFPGVNNGPVQIVSNQNIVAAERVIYRINGVHTSFTELMALPDSQIDTTYYLPWYNYAEVDTQLRFANVTNTPASVRVYIGGVEMQGSPFSLGAAESTRRSFPGINNGPVQIVSTVPIVAAERLIYKFNGVQTSFSETMALPASQLDTSYWLPWYNNLDLDTQLRFGIP